jgi:hypothetical protein
MASGEEWIVTLLATFHSLFARYTADDVGR